MSKLTVIIEGANFSSLDTFYDEVERKLTKNLDWEIGRNMNAFNDVLRGGFGVNEYEEPFKLIWTNSVKSKKDLGWDETIKYVSEKINTCHPTNIENVRTDLELAKQHKGSTLFELVIEIIKRHDHIELELT